MYALGMCVLQLGTLKPPFHHIPNEWAAVMAAAKGERPSRPDSLGGLDKERTSSLWLWMALMWDSDPVRRPSATTINEYISSTLCQWPPFSNRIRGNLKRKEQEGVVSQPREAKRFQYSPAPSFL